MPTPAYPSPPSMDAIPSEAGCWGSFSGFCLTVAYQNYGERMGIFYQLRTVFQEVTWARRSQLPAQTLPQSRQRKRNEFFRDLPSLCSHPPQRTGVACAEGAAGPKSQRADRVHLWGHLSSTRILAQSNAPRRDHDSDQFLNVDEFYLGCKKKKF